MSIAFRTNFPRDIYKFLSISLPSTQINSVHSTVQPMCLAQKGREHLKPTLCFIKRSVGKRETLVLGCDCDSDGNLDMQFSAGLSRAEKREGKWHVHPPQLIVLTSSQNRLRKRWIFISSLQSSWVGCLFLRAYVVRVCACAWLCIAIGLGSDSDRKKDHVSHC